MSGEKTAQKENQETETLEEETQDQLEKDLEAAADEAFGSEEEIEKQAAEASEENPGAEAPAETQDAPVDESGGVGEPGATDKKPEEKAGEKEPGEEKPDEDPYKIPDDMKGRTRERFEKLTGDLKQSHETISKQTEVIKGFREVVESSELNPKEFDQILQLGTTIKKDPRAALGTLKTLVSKLSEELGEVPPGADPLEGFDDLKQRVADRELTVEDAKEIAQGRIKKAAEDKRTQQQQQHLTQQQREEQEQKAFVERINGARDKVGMFLKESEKDPDYEKIAPYLVQAAKHAAENLDPDKWLGYIQSEFDRVKQIATEMSSQSGTGAQPILDGGAPPGGKPEPRTMEELAEQML